MTDRVAIERTLRTLLAEQGPGRSLSPSDIAQALEPEDGRWQRLLPEIRSIAAHLAQAGEIEVLRKGRPVDPTQPIKGVVRLRIQVL